MTESSANPLDRPRIVASGIAVFSAGALLFNLLPLVLGATADALALTSQQLGLLGSAYMAAFALVTVPAVKILQRVSWRRIGLVAGLVAVTALLAASQVRLYAGLVTLFLIAGSAMSLLFALGNRILGATSDPDRAFGIGYWVMLVIPSGLVFLFAHNIMPAWGYTGVYVTVAIVVGVLVTGCLPLTPEATPSLSPEKRQRLRPTLAIVLGLLAMAFYFVGLAGVWAFVERIGVSRGIAAETVGTILSIGLIVTAFGSLVPMVTEGRVTRGTMLIAGLVAMCAAMTLLSLPSGMLTFLVGALIFNFVWGTATVYISAIIAMADRSGSFLALIGGATGIGATIGPALAGGLVRGSDFTHVFIMCALAVLVSVTLAVLAERRASAIS